MGAPGMCSQGAGELPVTGQREGLLGNGGRCKCSLLGHLQKDLGWATTWVQLGAPGMREVLLLKF